MERPCQHLKVFLKAGMAKTTTLLFAELKSSKVSKERSLLLAKKVVEKVNELKANSLVIYISFDYDILREIIKIDSSALTMYLEGNKSPETLYHDNVYGADYHFSVYENTDSLIDKMKSLNLKLNVWTLNDSLKMDYFINQGFDFITSDEPELLLQKIYSEKSSQK
jgi:glycerophosphoryl diester phosphodiesterase